ncbi:MAG: lipid-A-disaccharide synthase [Xenococcaceae cyanobacterium MO_188.B29]|nr:lipid-A-disaccharide synthase [Xenococcaceae cyanobacterium MO_188.B29]
MRVFISTGEVSGDLQGAMLIDALQKQAIARGIDLEIIALGGDRMAAAGAKVIAHTTTVSSVGFLEALPFILPTLKIQQKTKYYLKNNPPDIVVLIDYPGSNLMIGNYLRLNFPHLPIIYYIAPQDWAVPMLGNAPKIAKIVDKILAIFPEEANYYKQKNIDVTWVGHPLLDRVDTSVDRAKARHLLDIKLEKTIITLLPASRQQEIQYLLPVICQAAKNIQEKLPQVHFLIPVSLNVYRQAIANAVKTYNLSATILEGKTLEAIAAADLAITKSGTVNLEIALLNVPQVVLYRINPFTAWVARNLLKFSIPLMSPPNLIVKKKIVPELQQEEATAERIIQESLDLLDNNLKREQMLADYQKMRSLLGEVGVCDRAAREILQLITQK